MRYSFDSRQIRPGDAFVALKGETRDGHDFIADARARGASLVVDGLDDLHARAKARRAELSARVIGVTGSSGKTTTKEILKSFLSRLGPTCATEGNFNNHIGLPLTILNCPDDAAFLVLEMGTNHPGEIATLCEIARPHDGLVTNVGTAHLEFFGAREALAHEKGTLLAQASDGAFFPAHDDFAAYLGSLNKKTHPVAGVPEGLIDPRAPHPPHFAENAALAFALASSLGLSVEAGAAALRGFSLPGARWRRVEKGGVVFVDDTYNANPDSMKAALEAFAAFPCAARRVVVLGDMLELGAEAPAFHREVFDAAKKGPFAAVVAVGELSSRCAADVAFPTVEALLAHVGELFRPGDAVLLKASHGLRLGRILDVDAAAANGGEK